MSHPTTALAATCAFLPTSGFETYRLTAAQHQEYYEGVLFLTTNRIKNIDEAFHSRIHVTVNYPNLSVDSRRHIWATFWQNLPTGGKELDRLAHVDLNGRQIKNVLKTAQMLARSEGNQEQAKDQQRVKVELRHIETILAIEQRSTSWKET